jgi:hypothetical protein
MGPITQVITRRFLFWGESGSMNDSTVSMTGAFPGEVAITGLASDTARG